MSDPDKISLDYLLVADGAQVVGGVGAQGWCRSDAETGMSLFISLFQVRFAVAASFWVRKCFVTCFK